MMREFGLKRALWIASGAAMLGLLGPSAAEADTVTLKNGREIHGRLVQEEADKIRIRTAGGEITIRKAEVATFSENATWGPERAAGADDVQDPPSQGGAVDGESEQSGTSIGGSPTPGERPSAQAGDAPASGGDSTNATFSKETWTWGADVTEEQIEELTPLRDADLEELEGLGPTKEERLEVTKTTSAEDKTIKEYSLRLSWNRRQGSANRQRELALKRILDEFDLKALPALVRLATDESFWKKRMAGRGLKQLARGDDERWLLYHYDAPAALITHLDAEGSPVDSPFIRSEGNDALETICKTSMGFKPSTESLRTREETEAYKKWRSYWAAEKARWDKEQEEKAARREELHERLGKIQEGINPDKESEGRPERGSSEATPTEEAGPPARRAPRQDPRRGRR